MDVKLLHRFFEGETNLEEEAVVRQWMCESPENERIILEERKLFDKLLLHSGKVKLPAVDDNDDSGLSESITRPSRTFVWIRELAKIAAIICITLLGVSFFFKSFTKKEEISAMQTISVPSGQRLNLILPDGTDVWLNAKTTLKYPVTFNKKERLVLLDGQAYFDVAKNKDVPFVVKTKSGVVQAIGTKFDIMAYSENSSFETVLMEGKVKVESAKDSTQRIILTPNNKVCLKEGKLETTHVDDFSAYAWKDGLISFRNESFEKIMKSFEKIYDINIVIRNPKIATLIYTGKFRVVDGVDYALRVLQRDIKFKYERDIEKHIIYIK